MTSSKTLALILGVLLGSAWAGNARASLTIHKSDDSELDFFATGQMLGMAQKVPDDVKKDARLYLFLQQARLGFSGHLGDYNFYTELALGGENMTPGSANPAFTLLEMRFDVPTWNNSFVRVGQFKTPYGAEFLTPDNGRLFTESSIANLGSNWGREIGMALVSKSDFFNGAVGVFTGGGEDTSVLPIHALPEDFGSPLMVARLGLDDSGAGALSHQQAGVFKIDHAQKAIYLQGAFEKDTFIGHSSAMNIKAGQANMVYQQNVLLNTAWNPYLTLTDKAYIYSVGLNGVLRGQWGDTVLTGEFQADQSGFSDNQGSLVMHTVRLQGSAAHKPWEAALRVASLLPSASMGPTNFPGTIGATPFFEVTPALSYYLKDWSKLVFEFQGLINVPVAHEPGDGSYVLADMPSQTTYTSGTRTLPDTITRNFVPEVKLMWQIAL